MLNIFEIEVIRKNGTLKTFNTLDEFVNWRVRKTSVRKIPMLAQAYTQLKALEEHFEAICGTRTF